MRKESLREIKCSPTARLSVISGKQPSRWASANECVRLGFTCWRPALAPCYSLNNEQIMLFAAFLSGSYYL